MIGQPFDEVAHGEWTIEICEAKVGDGRGLYYRCSWKRKPSREMVTFGGADGVGRRALVAKSPYTVEVIGEATLEDVCAMLDEMTKEKKK